MAGALTGCLAAPPEDLSSADPARRRSKGKGKSWQKFRYPGRTHEATLAALRAHRLRTPEEAVAAAREALEISPDCAEAYCLLAKHAASLEAALELYQTAERLARAVGPLEVMQHEVKYMWKLIPLRCWMR